VSNFLAWKRVDGQFFGEGSHSIEKLQKPWPPEASYELIETSYFGFSIPEHKINCEIYFWLHPVFNVASGGVMIFQGIKEAHNRADFLDYRNYMPIPDDITNCTYANGVRVKMIRPLEEFEISYADPESGTAFRFTARAIMPPAFRAAGGHITQAMKTEGSLSLNGRDYKIDNYFSRDRSWGDPRTEVRKDVPPFGWHVMVFDDDLAFHVCGFESPELKPSIGDRYPSLRGNSFIWGYVWKGGRLLGVLDCRKTVVRGDGVTPQRINLEIDDETGETHRIEGVIESLLPMETWPNLTCFWALTRWTYEGRTGYGDTQEGVYNRFVLENLRAPGPEEAPTVRDVEVPSP